MPLDTPPLNSNGAAFGQSTLSRVSNTPYLYILYATLRAVEVREGQRAAVKNVRLGEADGLKNFHPQKWVPNAIK
jgi:hypothetical protein